MVTSSAAPVKIIMHQPKEAVRPNRMAGGPPWTDEVRLSLSMHELSLSMPEPMLSPSMLILATKSVFYQRDGFRQPYSNFSNRPDPHAQNRGTILMGIAVWRVTIKQTNESFLGACQF